MKGGEKERSEGRTLRVDRIGAPNLGIRICRLICGFHRNCLSTRCLHAPGRPYPPILCLVLRNTRAWCSLTCSPVTRLRLSSVDTSYTRWPYVPLFHSSASSGGAFSRGRLQELISSIEVLESNLTRLSSVLNTTLSTGPIAVFFNSR